MSDNLIPAFKNNMRYVTPPVASRYTKEELEEMRDILTSVDVDDLDLEPVEEQARTK